MGCVLTGHSSCVDLYTLEDVCRMAGRTEILIGKGNEMEHFQLNEVGKSGEIEQSVHASIISAFTNSFFPTSPLYIAVWRSFGDGSDFVTGGHIGLPRRSPTLPHHRKSRAGPRILGSSIPLYTFATVDVVPVEGYSAYTMYLLMQYNITRVR